MLIGVLVLAGFGSGCARRRGFVVLAQLSMGLGDTGVAGTVVTAVFNGGIINCNTQTTEGSCRLLMCPTDGPAGGPSTTVSAGIITISGGALTSPRSFTFEAATGQYGTGPLMPALERYWTGEQTLRVQGTGAAGGVPAFDQTVTGPSAIDVTAPALSARGSGMSVHIPRNTALNVAWTGGASGTVQVVLSAPRLANGVVPTSVDCSFAASSGTGVVSSNLLSMLPAGDGSITVVNQNTETVTAGDYDVTVQAVQQATAAGGQIPDLGATFE
jgi:hypothetical protein